MMRALVLLLVLAVLADAAYAAAAGEPGRATLEWVGWRVDTSALAAIVLVALAALAFTVLSRLLLFLLAAPSRARRARAETRRRQAIETMTKGFIAAAAGEGAEARRLAQKAADLTEEQPALARLLAAQAAEAAGDAADAQAAYTAMLSFPELRLAAHRGLMQAAVAQGDRAAGARHAQEAYDLPRTARWAWSALFEARLQAAAWRQALELVQNGLDRKLITPAMAERARAALLAVSAADAERGADAKARAQAVDQAVQAAKLKPGFAPGVVVAARLLHAEGKFARAASLLESAWKECPHPALWLAYRDLRVDETPRERSQRLQHLVSLNPEHRESRILDVEQALLAGDRPGAQAAAARLDQDAPTARICGLMARAAMAAGSPDEARAWITRASAASHEPDWSDLDPEGEAFNYTREDWARVVAAYAETGDLVHPRYDRHEPVVSELPELPMSYTPSVPFVGGALSAAPQPDDPGAYGDPLQPEAVEAPPPPTGREPRWGRR